MEYEDLVSLLEKIDRETGLRHTAFLSTYGCEWEFTFPNFNDLQKERVFDTVEDLYEAYGKNNEKLFVKKLDIFKKNYINSSLTTFK